MDNTSYCSAILNKGLLANSGKSEIVDWLKKKNIKQIQLKPEQSCFSMFDHSRCTKYMNWTKSVMSEVIRLYNYHHTIANVIL
jgi:hypothetical protein